MTLPNRIAYARHLMEQNNRGRKVWRALDLWQTAVQFDSDFGAKPVQDGEFKGTGYADQINNAIGLDPDQSDEDLIEIIAHEAKHISNTMQRLTCMDGAIFTTLSGLLPDVTD
jgi:hypothetical protein